MARPVKQGLDYFNLDCHFDDKVELVIAEFGMTGLGILIRLFQKIYSENGYYCCWNDDVALLFNRNNGLSGNVVSELINACLRRGIFSREMFEHCSILTSEGIQKRYFDAVTKRKSIEWINEYLLIDMPVNKVNDGNNSINSINNSVNDGNNSQIKLNKTKSDEIKQKQYEEDNSSPSSKTMLRSTKLHWSKNIVFLTKQQEEKLISEYGEALTFDYVERLYSYLYEGTHKVKNHYKTIVKWINEDRKL